MACILDAVFEQHAPAASATAEGRSVVDDWSDAVLLQRIKAAPVLPEAVFTMFQIENCCIVHILSEDSIVKEVRASPGDTPLRGSGLQKCIFRLFAQIPTLCARVSVSAASRYEQNSSFCGLFTISGNS
ncbi:hypothetical protein OE88DRAFT_164673 [Heliocybe sulcata]|uniref:Uncharacterized protein n=1 Tax=Heliocybe sulcata TaxID=5364 RepID=A0A5C3NVF5_9AGAM|nr:hypothetical protein OE88DRAFT_164673 [Heliocybe sulcata]